MSWTTVLRGAGNQIELNRLVGFVGGMAYVVCANVFVGWEVIGRAREFDITAYCLAFPGGLAVVAGGTAAAVAIKDRNVAAARAIEATGSPSAKSELAG
ncbi:hypothetical protein GR702_13205 [Novosphingobium sp. FGD1]|uniref:YiaAB two helix domain-containing protein n=1 Tax=Novosphingobium silvae TaxID=2692619 RepID=A0A7X4K752_9SPHN|nr:hypothetical protein [Novosphingobium silvae]MYL98721.1 hypothetical protein [Novosphingobium silvae]